MAKPPKPLEICFSAIRHNPHYRFMKALDRGIFVALVQACLLDGYDPLPTEPRTLQFLAGCTSMQWYKANAGVFKALDALLPELRTMHQYSVKKQETSKRIGKEYLAAAAKRKALERKANNAKNVFISDQVNTHNPLQPVKKKVFRPDNQDYITRTTAYQEAKSSKPILPMLTDKVKN